MDDKLSHKKDANPKVEVTVFHLNDEEQKRIWIDTILKPSIESELKTMATWRSRWSTIGNVTEVLGKVIAGLGTILAYTAGFVKEQNLVLSLSSGVTGTVAIVLLQYSAFSKKKAKEANTKFKDIITSWSSTNIENLVTKERSESTVSV